jgi:hypothetical protein
MTVLSWLVFVPLELIWLPMSLFGAILVGYRQMVVSKRLGVSQTAIEVFNGRWTMDLFEIRADGGAVALGKVLPNTSTNGLFLCLFPLWVKWKIAGKLSMYPRVVERGHESIAELVTARTAYVDEVINRQASQVEQLVMLGAGYDTRAYGALEIGGLTVFEVDQKTTQEHKRAMLRSAGLDASHVTFTGWMPTADKAARTATYHRQEV